MRKRLTERNLGLRFMRVIDWEETSRINNMKKDERRENQIILDSTNIA